MKYFLAKFTITDNGHDHFDQCLIRAKKKDDAINLAIKEGDDPEGKKTESYFSFGDGCSSCNLDTVQEITKAEAKLLNRLGVADFLN